MSAEYKKVALPVTKVQLPSWEGDEAVTVEGNAMGTVVLITIGGKSALVDACQLANVMAAIKVESGICVIPKLR